MSIGKSMSIAVMIMAASNLLSRLLGYLRIALLAHIVGAGAEADAYVFSFIVPDLLNHLLAGSALSITFIPIFQKLLSGGDENRAWRFFSNVFTIGTILFLALTVVGMAYTENILMLAGKNINDPAHPEKLRLTVRLTRLILPAQLFFFWGALFNGVQYAKKRFLLPSLAPLLYNIGIISGGLFLQGLPGSSAEGFSWGVLAGAFAGNVLIQLPGAIRAGMRFRPLIDLKDPNLGKYALLTLPLALGMGMTFSNEFMFKYVGSFVRDGTGALASLDYAYKLAFLFVGVFGQGTAAGLYPFISQLAVEKKFGEIAKLLNNVLQKLAGLAFPIAAVSIALALPLVTIALQRGRFDSAAAAATASHFSLYIGGAFFFASVLVVYRAFFAMQNTLLPMIVSTATVLASLPVYIGMARWTGARGIALSVSISACAQFLIIYYIWMRRIKGSAGPTIKRIIPVIGVSIIGGLLCHILKRAVLAAGLSLSSAFLHNLVLSMAAGIPALAATFLLLHVTNLFTITDLARIFSRKEPHRAAGSR
jgi:putative peptidoglycan lipid II flippase